MRPIRPFVPLVHEPKPFRETRAWFATIIVLALLLCLSVDAARTDIVVFLADDLGGRRGLPRGQIATRNIDALAALGVRLEQFLRAATLLADARALLTGRYPMRLGLQWASSVRGPVRAAAGRTDVAAGARRGRLRDRHLRQVALGHFALSIADTPRVRSPIRSLQRSARLLHHVRDGDMTGTRRSTELRCRLHHAVIARKRPAS